MEVVDGRRSDRSEWVHDFEELYTRLFPRALAFARRHLTTEQALDVVQDASFDQHCRWNDPPPERRTTGYFMRVVRGFVFDECRRGYTNLEASAVDPEDVAGSSATVLVAPAPDAIYEREEQLAMIRRVVGTFPQQMHAVWMLCREEGMSMRDAAEVLELSHRTVERHMLLATQSLREEAERVGLRLPSPRRRALSAPLKEVPDA